MMGNRGILHDHTGRIVRRYAVKRWIACVLEFRGRRRSVMTPGRYTELFFLDEATALAAGHRPCAECRRADYLRFRELWSACIGGPADADSMDARLHAERLAGKDKRIYRQQANLLPDGTYIVLDSQPWLLWQGELHGWGDSGYSQRRPIPRGELEVLTPRSLVSVLGAGYRPGVHPSVSRR